MCRSYALLRTPNTVEIYWHAVASVYNSVVDSKPPPANTKPPQGKHNKNNEPWGNRQTRTPALPCLQCWLFLTHTTNCIPFPSQNKTERCNNTALWNTHLCCGCFDVTADKVCLAIQCCLGTENKVFLSKQSNWSVIVCGKEGVCLEIVCTNFIEWYWDYIL